MGEVDEVEAREKLARDGAREGDGDGGCRLRLTEEDEATDTGEGSMVGETERQG